MVNKYILKFNAGLILINPNEIFPIKPAEIKISQRVESFDKKKTRKLTKFQRYWIAHGFQTIQDISNFNRKILKLELNFKTSNRIGFIKTKYTIKIQIY